MDNHLQFMKICIKYGIQAMKKGNPPVGSIVVKNFEIIGKGIEGVKTLNNITKHAEIEAVNDALLSKQIKKLKNCTLYTTHEPCIMCSYVLRHYEIKTIVYGVSVEHTGGFTSEFKILESENVPNWGKAPKIIGGILKDECLELSHTYHLINKL